MARFSPPLLAAFAAFAACSDEGSQLIPTPDPTAPPLLGADCDPLVPTACGYPFPSNVYLADDPTTATGKRVAFGKTTLPAFALNQHANASAWSDSDGFSPGQSPMTHLPGATVTGLPTFDTIPVSLSDGSPTVLIEADTGARVPHFAELDMSSFSADSRAFMIRPVIRLKDATRYIVAIRHVVDASGAALPPSPVFQALRDGTAGYHVSIDRRRALYADIFARLAKAGVASSDLQIAWDFTTASKANNTRALLHMRDDALQQVGAAGPPYTVTSVEETPNAHIRRRMRVAMTVPLYLDRPDAGGRLVYGPDGLPKQNGTAQFDVIVHIPNSVVSAPAGALLQYGHGLFGMASDGGNGTLAEIADKGRYVMFGVDLEGMAADDVPFVANMLAGDLAGFRALPDRLHQGFINSLLAMRLMKGAFANDPHVIFGGASAIDPARAYYRGDSQGGISGAVYMALSTDVTRGLLAEPGFPYSFIMPRSADSGPFFAVLRATYRSALDVQLCLGLVQMMWDRAEPDGYAPYIRENMLPGTPAHEVLIHDGIGDHQVSTLGAHLLARTIGVTNMQPVNRDVWGIPEAPMPFTGSAMVEYSFGLPPIPLTNVPPTAGNDPHDILSTLDSAQQQSFRFLKDGVVASFCSGPCSGPD